MVSPGWAWIALVFEELDPNRPELKKNEKVPSDFSVPKGFPLLVLGLAVLGLTGEVGADDVVGLGVAESLQPAAASEAVVPPLGLHTHFIAADVTVAKPVVGGRSRLGALQDLSAEPKFVDASLAAFRTTD